MEAAARDCGIDVLWIRLGAVRRVGRERETDKTDRKGKEYRTQKEAARGKRKVITY